MQVSRQNLQELLNQLVEVDAATGFHFTAYQAAQTVTNGLLVCLDQLPQVTHQPPRKPTGQVRHHQPDLRQAAQRELGSYLKQVSQFNTLQLQRYLQEHLDQATYRYARPGLHAWLGVLERKGCLKRLHGGRGKGRVTYAVTNAAHVYAAQPQN